MSSKRMRYDRIALVERNADEEDESSEEEEEDAESGSEPADDDTRSMPLNQRAEQQTAKQGKIHVALNKSSELVCHVCGGKGHRAGFVGATYVDCPNKPCYLCKGVGHTTATCPHRALPGAAAAAAAAAAPAAAGQSTSELLMQREQRGHHGRQPLCPSWSPPWQVEAAILKLHSRRVTCLEFPGNSDSHVLSGDKKGGIAVWNFMQVHDRTLYSTIHRALVNTLRWSPWLAGGFNCMSVSSDGTAKIFDVETGVSQTLMDLNPDGWHRGCKWNMFYGADANQELGIILAGDSDGKVHLLDPRSSSSSSSAVASIQLHKGGSKVNSVAVNPVGGARVVLTAGGDHKVKLFDLRKLSSMKPPTNSPAGPATPAAAAAAAAVSGSSPGAADDQAAAAAAAAAVEGGSSSGRGRGRGAGRGGKRKAAAAADVGEDSAAAAAAAGSSRGRGRGRGSSAAAPPAAAAAAGGSTTASKASIRSAMAAAVAAAAAAELAVMQHGRVVNHAVFSPSGRKILTTCQDNRLRIWENLLTCGGPPTKEIVHSHDFNRYLTPFKAEWFQNDPSESKVVCGRYISEDFGGVALHPIDIFDVATGRLLQQLTDLNLSTITPVNKPHPRLDIIISGSSRSLYKWVPQTDDDEDDSLHSAASQQRCSTAAADLIRAASTAAAAAARSSSNFMCVDADPNGSGATKRGGTAGGGTKSVTKTKSVTTKAKSVTTKGKVGSSTKAAAAAAARGKGKKRGRAAAADDDDDGEEDEESDDAGDSDDE